MMMNDKVFFSHLFEIASHLNKEVSLPSALRRSLEKTAEVLGVETGWIWLTEPDNKSVYLATSYNLPPALSNHPERLSGWCYCIKQYLADDINQAMNISEITCTRLRDITTGTNDLKFHATIPIITNGQKVGLMNLLSAVSRQLNERELTLLNAISDLIGTAIQRTRLQQSFHNKNLNTEKNIHRVLERIFHPELQAIIACLDDANKSEGSVKEALRKAKGLQQQLTLLHGETQVQEQKESNTNGLVYPSLPLTKRELEVLALIKKGLTNSQIGRQLFIAERTVKFHVTGILSKLNASTRTEAVDISLTRGLLSL